MLPDLSLALLRDIRQLFEDADDYNVLIQVGEEPNIEVFKAHSVILKARSPYFRAAFSTKWAKKKGDTFTYKKPNISPKIFKDILKYIYTGTINLKNEVQKELLELIVAADELVLEELVEHIQEHLVTNESEWLIRNIIQVHQMASRHKTCGMLQDFCEKEMCKDASLIFQSSDFAFLEETSLIALLKREDLNMCEIEIWNYVIRWGMEQNPLLSSNDVTKWTSEDFAIMEQTLKGCIPHIRFFQISSTDYYYKVRPYKKLLPSDLKERIKRFIMVPGSESEFNILPPRKSTRLPGSKLMTIQFVSLISRWIDKEVFTHNDDPLELSKVPYEFRLLACGSRDGISRQVFHDKCNNQGATLVVLKVGDSNLLIGGYNPVYWSSSGRFISTKDSFIFSLGQGNDLQNEAILSRVVNHEQAIRDCGVEYGCLGFGCGDLHIIEGTSKRKDYERDIINISPFVINDYEVFQVIKKN